MRLNGCPSLTLRENPDPLRDDPIAHVDDTCVGCGVCGEVAHAAVLCPSFYEVKVITNPDLVDAVRESDARGRHPPARGRRDVTDPPHPEPPGPSRWRAGGRRAPRLDRGRCAHRRISRPRHVDPRGGAANRIHDLLRGALRRAQPGGGRHADLLAVSRARSPRRPPGPRVPRGRALDRARFSVARPDHDHRQHAPSLLDPREDRDRARIYPIEKLQARPEPSPGGSSPSTRWRSRASTGPKRTRYCSERSQAPAPCRFVRTRIARLFAPRAFRWTPTFVDSRPGSRWRWGRRRVPGRGRGASEPHSPRTPPGHPPTAPPSTLRARTSSAWRLGSLKPFGRCCSVP